MRTCQICSREFTKPYNLRIHHARFHPTEPIPALERVSRTCSMNQRGGLDQVGGGDIRGSNIDQYGGRVHESDDDDGDDDGDDEGDSMLNNAGSESDSDSESDMSLDDGVDRNWVFDSIIEEAEEELGNNATHTAIRKLFRRKLVDRIEWVRNLRRNNIYKKILATAQELQDGPGEYDREEALQIAVRQRRFLLNRLIPNPALDNESHDDDGGTDEGDDVSDEEAGASGVAV